MTRSTKTKTLTTLATASIVALTLAACGNNAAEEAETPTEATTEAPATEAPETEEQDDAQGARDYEAAVTGLTYHGEPLEVGAPGELEGGSFLEVDPDGIEFTPAECEALLTGSLDRLNAATSDSSEAAFAVGDIENIHLGAQVRPGAAREVDLDKSRELTDTCSTLQLFDGQAGTVLNFESFPLDVAGADDTHGEFTIFNAEGGHQYLTTAYAIVDDDLVLVTANLEKTDTAEIETIMNQIVSALK